MNRARFSTSAAALLGLSAVCLLLGCSRLVEAEQDEPPVVGWLEQVKISSPGILLHAKLDTGADNCSVNAENLRRYRRKGESWVEFELSSRYGERKKFRRRVIRIAKVKKKTGGAQKRPVVRLGLCLGEFYETIECNLVDRSHFSYPVLVGRNFLAGTAMVNSSETYTTKPSCSVKPETK